MQRRFKEPGRVSHPLLGNLHPPLRRRRQMRRPIDKGERKRDRRYAAGQARRQRVKRAVALERFRLRRFVSFGRRLGRDGGATPSA